MVNKKDLSDKLDEGKVLKSSSSRRRASGFRRVLNYLARNASYTNPYSSGMGGYFPPYM